MSVFDTFDNALAALEHLSDVPAELAGEWQHLLSSGQSIADTLDNVAAQQWVSGANGFAQKLRHDFTNDNFGLSSPMIGEDLASHPEFYAQQTRQALYGALNLKPTADLSQLHLQIPRIPLPTLPSLPAIPWGTIAGWLALGVGAVVAVPMMLSNNRRRR